MKKKIASFNQMNTLLRCVLLFFILGAGAVLYMSYTAVLPSSSEDLQTIERGASYMCKQIRAEGLVIIS